MSLVLSNAFKGLLLSSHVNIKYDLAVKSFQDLIDKIEMKNNKMTVYKALNGNAENSHLISKLKKRSVEMALISFHGTIWHDRIITKFQNGQAVILCNTKLCPIIQILNPHLKLIYSNDHKMYSFVTLRVEKSHSHSLQIYKL